KLDRRALPMPDTGRPVQEQAYLAPRDQLETALAEMWQAALGLDQVGVADNFFELGGNSIIGALVMNQLQERLGGYVPAVAIFTSPTIGKLSNYLREHHAAALSRVAGATTAIKLAAEWTPLVEIQRGGAERPLFFVHPAGGNVTCYFELAQLLGPEQPFY